MEIPNFFQVRLLVVGDVMLDRYWNGSTSRISPEAPVPVVHINQEEDRLGGSANVARNASMLGAQTQLLGLVGEDTAADTVEKMLTNSGVACRLRRVSGSRTITKLRVLSHHQQMIRLDFEDHFTNWDADALYEDFTGCLANFDVVILSDYAKGALRRSHDMISTARKAGIPVIVDPKGTDFERYRGATLITPNLSEFEALVGRCDSDAEIERRGVDLREQLDLDAVLVTRSEQGMTLLARGHAAFHIPTRAQEVFDVTGAGDTVVATLGAAIAAGISLHEATVLANIAAGIVVAKLGTASVSPAEFSRAMQSKKEDCDQRICDEDGLLANSSLIDNIQKAAK